MAGAGQTAVGCAVIHNRQAMIVTEMNGGWRCITQPPWAEPGRYTVASGLSIPLWPVVDVQRYGSRVALESALDRGAVDWGRRVTLVVTGE